METDWRELIDQLRAVPDRRAPGDRHASAKRIVFDDGLSDAEVAIVEDRYGFRFPPDLRSLLQTALPCGPGFPDWRADDEEELRSWLDAPWRGIRFDIERNGFWLEEWGICPDSLADACDLAHGLYLQAPQLIPIYIHRMMPEEPHRSGNPVFSVHQTDIIYYGYDLVDYLRHEFYLPGREPWPDEVRAIRYWDIDRFQDGAWSNGPRGFDNSKGLLPK